MADTLTSYAELADILDNLPFLVREGRRSRGLNLRDAGKQSGVGFNTLSRVERGMDCMVPNAIAILRWLDTRQPADGEQTGGDRG
jgi:hypothetical protein